ncbi:glycosyl hydrolase catalytic core-domain-containing protein [Amylocystis lapponica]|nr:glycosyl hydrolase catalytic core-domain-containing protein [Amylocystis lapponica]
MKFSVFASLALFLAGTVYAAHIPNFKAPRAPHHKRGGPSATISGPATTSNANSPAQTSSGATGAAFSSGIKRGLSFNDASLTEKFNSQQISWVYNWASSYEGTLPDGVVYIPMLWSDDDAHTATWTDDANKAIAAGAPYLLAFNEPDLSSQSNLTPQQAAAAYQKYMMPFAGKAKLVSPAITNGAAPMGEAWLDSFLAACTNCQIDAVAMHIYDSATNEAYYQNYISSLATKYGKPVWVTEFGATGSDSQVQSFLGSMVSFLDGLEGVAAYAWFMDTVGNLVNSDASLTSLGGTYVA